MNIGRIAFSAVAPVLALSVTFVTGCAKNPELSLPGSDIANAAPSASAAAPTVTATAEVDGTVTAGLRVLPVPVAREATAGAEAAIALRVYRGDYIRFEGVYGASAGEVAAESPVFAIPELGVSTTLGDMAAQGGAVKMTKVGSYAFSVGSIEGRIEVKPFASRYYRELDAKGAYDFIRNAKPFVLDVRRDDEYAAVHIAGATLVPLDRLASRLGELAAYRDEDVLVYCHSGNRSTTAAKILIDSGFTRVSNMSGGIAAWIAAGFPVE